MLYKNLFLLWNNKYFLILPLNVISTQPCISGQTVHLPGGGRGGGGRRGRGASHSVVFPAGSKMPQCLVCRQLWFSYIFREFLSPVPFESPGAYIDSQDTGDWGLQGIAGHSTRA